MSAIKLMKGNEAIAEAAIQAGCRHYFGYPITPQNEIIEYLAKKMPAVNGVCIQAESEIAAINMVYGASCAGARAMTSSSSPGISLKQEAISYLAAGELPCVIANLQRAGPGLGGIAPGQADYFQATKGGGHGDYRLIVLAPASVQEAFNMTIEAFDLADRYRSPVMILGDGAIGQVMEKVEAQSSASAAPEKPWAVSGLRERHTNNVIKTLHLSPEDLEVLNNRLQEKYKRIVAAEAIWEEQYVEDADLVLVAYGIAARIAQSAMESAREKGLKVGMIRPKTLWPFPQQPLEKAARKCRAFLVCELSAGQMVEDVLLAVKHRRPVHFFGKTGGIIPRTSELLKNIRSLLEMKESDKNAC